MAGAAHIGCMNARFQTRPASLPNRIPLPSTPGEIHDAAVLVQRLRAGGMSWREVSERTGYARVDAIQLAHNLFGLTDAAYEASKEHVRTGVWYEGRSA